MSKTTHMQLGPLCVAWHIPGGTLPPCPLGDPHLDFLHDTPQDGLGNRFNVTVKPESPPDELREEFRTSSPETLHRAGWEIRTHANNTCTAALPIPPGTNRYQRVLVHAKNEATLYVPKEAERSNEPLAYLVTEILWLLCLNTTSALLLHASGIQHGENTLIFPGSSGAGKSTLARLCKENGAEVLADESVILWQTEHPGVDTHASGTPWPGSAGVWSNTCGKAQALCFLEHGTKNALTPLPIAEAGSGLLAQTFLPIWDTYALAAATERALRIAETVPVYRFAFRPDKTAVAFLRELFS